MTALSPTPEQQRALDLFQTGTDLAIEAGAGTGKTSTLVLLAATTRRRGQYVAFNRAIVNDAGAKMPATVNCSTAHALAFRAVGHRFKTRLKSPRMKSTELARRLRLDPVEVTKYDDTRKRISASFLAGLTMRALVRFCQSADAEPTRRHVPWVEGVDAPKNERGASRTANDEIARHVEPALRRAWADWQDPDGELPYKHDAYLKLWERSQPRLGCDFVLFDECQDASPVMLSIIEQQPETVQRVYVGDSQQQIYGFTGAINALGRIRESGGETAFLTQSFRFGPEIADVANNVLGLLDAELRLRGTDTIASVVREVDRPAAILSRTNATAVRAVLAELAAGRKVHLVGGAGEIVSFVRAAQRLINGQAPDHPELDCFDSWSEVQEYVTLDQQGGDLRLFVKLIDDFGINRILEALDRIADERQADVVVSTAHKAKGREWSTVRLADDFPETDQDEELRLLYVAVTRARVALDISGVAALSNGAGAPEGGETAPEPSAVSEAASDAEIAPGVAVSPIAALSADEIVRAVAEMTGRDAGIVRVELEAWAARQTTSFGIRACGR